MKMIFLSLPVEDLSRARSFYEGLGFRINEHSSDESTASVVVDENIVVTLQTRDRFADVVGAEGVVEPGTEIDGITTPDEHTVRFKLRRATGGTLAAALVLPLDAPVPREYALPLDDENVIVHGVQ